ncbi:MAG: SPOR domain-containing protein [Holophagae bacterium]|jgi:cell division septation protein DedD
MSRSYYVIELSARWLTVLLVALAAVMVLAFALGYGAARSVASRDRSAPQIAALQGADASATEIPEVVIPTEIPVATEPPAPTPQPEPTSTATPRPEPTVPPTPQPTATKAVTEFFVQVLASDRRDSVDQARSKLRTLGFPDDSQRLIPVEGGGTTLYKLRIGPFPDRSSAERVAQRMSSSGFPDAWIVAP